MSSGSPLGSHDFIRKNKKVNAKISVYDLVMCVGTQKPALYTKKKKKEVLSLFPVLTTFDSAPIALYHKGILFAFHHYSLYSIIMQSLTEK